DAHDLLSDGAGGLIVANGGVTLLPETGRLKRQLDTMDSSIVRLDAQAGHLTGQWRLADRRLSLRHLAWGPRGAGERQLGVALQAEHQDPAERAAAPVLAVFDGRTLQTCLNGGSLAGYGGDIVGTPTGFAVSCPRADAVATWHADGRWDTQHPQAKACALLMAGERALWSGGANAVAWGDAQTGPHTLSLPQQPPLQLDNHWALLAQRGARHEFIEKGNTS
ncbi:MAG TPA: DUF1513 domain-containing protein, partial [Burkholderiaceae bacterium]|nr:DUF1513 domain-containing protein [Burkholderiaceae bacterium]